MIGSCFKFSLFISYGFTIFSISYRDSSDNATSIEIHDQNQTAFGHEKWEVLKKVHIHALGT